MNDEGKKLKVPKGWIIILNLFSGLVILFFLFTWTNDRIHHNQIFFPHFKAKVSSEVSDQIEKERKVIEKNVSDLKKKFDALTPTGNYIVINTTKNQFTVYKKKELLYQGFCSTGSMTLLETDTDKQWLFQTPKGVFSVKNKVTDPLWKKPDWAFVEEGLPIPPANDPSRFEYGVLGDYALYIGNGYLIHGTLFQRFIGLPVTHGCIRLNDEDLKYVYQNLAIGSKVFIY